MEIGDFNFMAKKDAYAKIFKKILIFRDTVTNGQMFYISRDLENPDPFALLPQLICLYTIFLQWFNILHKIL